LRILSKLSSLNLKTKIIVTVLLLFLGSIWTLTFLIAKQLERNMSDQIEKQQFSTASYIADIIENQVKLRINSLNAIASEITPELIADPGQLKNFLRRNTLLSSLFQTGVAVISRDGKGIADHPTLSGRSGASYIEMEYFQEVVVTKKPTVGKPRIGRFSNKPVISFAVPVLSPSGELTAVLAGFTLLSDPVLLGAFKSSIYKDFPDGLLLSSPKYRIHITGSDGTRNMTPTPETGRNPLFDRFMAGYEGSGNTVNIRGVRIFLSAKQIPSAGWFIRVGMPTDIAFAPIHEMKSLAYSIAFGLSLLSCLVVGLMIRNALGPLYSAIALIQDITEGTQPLQDIPVIQHDEIGQLLTTFNLHMTYRKQAEEALQKQHADKVLRESNEQHRTIIQTAMDGFWMADMQGHLLEVNETYSQMSGYSMQELLAMCISDLEVIETPADLATHMQRIIAQGEDRFETRHRRKDGSILTVEVSVQYRSIDGGRMVAFLRDITERKRVEAALQENENIFRGTFEQSAVGIAHVSLEGGFIRINQRFCDIVGYSSDEMFKLTFQNITYPEDLEADLNNVRQVLEGSLDTYSMEKRYIRKDGQLVWVNLTVALLRDATRQPMFFISVIEDITDRKQTEKQLRESEERFRLAINATRDGLWEWDIRTNQEFFSPRWCEIIGYSFDDPELPHTYDSWASRIHPDDYDRVVKAMKNHVENGVEYNLDYRHRHKSDEYHWQNSRGQAVFDESGKPVKMVGCISDITEDKQTEQMLRQQWEELSHVSRVSTVGEFAASIAHEIHQPLTAILNNAQAVQRFLSSDTPAIDEVSDAIQDIIADDRRAAEVIRHLRLFLKREEADRAILDINGTIGEVLTILHGEILDKNVSVTSDLSNDLPCVEGGRVELQQVIMNLILNGCDSMMDVDIQRRQMRIVTSVDEPNNVLIAVQDSGTGLDKSVMERVFEPYYTTKREGLGMGLSVSKTIIAAHGGRIWAANNPEGGATFSFTLPIHKGNTL
jgi:PAS domain S-box-containing protein